MALTATRLTLEEFLELPERKPALEFIDGTVRQKVAPRVSHSGLQTVLAEQINGSTRSRKLAWALTELRTTYAGASTVPDISVLRWERLPRDASGKLAAVEFYEPPDIAIEIASPRQNRSQLVRRCQWYVAHGVPAALLFDPRSESARVFRATEQSDLLYSPARIDLSDIVPGLVLRLDEIFDALR